MHSGVRSTNPINPPSVMLYEVKLATYDPPPAPTITYPLNGSYMYSSNRNLTWTAEESPQGNPVSYQIIWIREGMPDSMERSGITTTSYDLPGYVGEKLAVRACDAVVGVCSGNSNYTIYSLDYVNFAFTNKSISEAVIYQSSGSTTISLNINDSDGTITSATMEITFAGVPYNYSLTQGAGDTWSYGFRSSIPGTYTVTAFYATDNLNGTNSTTWNQQFAVVPIEAGGSPGGDVTPAASPGGSGSPAGLPGSPPAPDANTTTSPSLDINTPDLPKINLRTMGETKVGEIILYGGMGVGLIMMVLGASSKSLPKSSMFWGIIIVIMTAYGLGIID